MSRRTTNTLLLGGLSTRKELRTHIPTDTEETDMEKILYITKPGTVVNGGTYDRIVVAAPNVTLRNVVVAPKTSNG